jgi:hypothetical protein
MEDGRIAGQGQQQTVALDDDDDDDDDNNNNNNNNLFRTDSLHADTACPTIMPELPHTAQACNPRR